MKRIKIDNSLIKKVQDFNVNLFNGRRSDFVKPLEKLRRLRVDFCCKNQIYFANYICLIEKNYLELLSLKPLEFKKWIDEFNSIFNFESLPSLDSKNQNDKNLIKDLCYRNNCNENDIKTFADKIVEAMRYDEYRESEYPKIINNLSWNLKTCFYCNYAGTLTIKTNSKYKTYYDLDHILPKSIYPFLSTSFFNFIPSCASCNRSKSSQVIPELNPFYESGEANVELRKIFEITKKSKVQFYNKLDRNHIQIKVAGSINNISKTDLDKIVDLELLYNTQKHEAEEILWKKKIYSKAYFKSVQSAFSKLHLKKHEMNRILWGTDLDEETINDKPLAKFKFDLINDK